MTTRTEKRIRYLFIVVSIQRYPLSDETSTIVPVPTSGTIPVEESEGTRWAFHSPSMPFNQRVRLSHDGLLSAGQHSDARFALGNRDIATHTMGKDGFHTSLRDRSLLPRCPNHHTLGY